MTRRLRRLHLVLIVLVIAALAVMLPRVRPEPPADVPEPAPLVP